MGVVEKTEAKPGEDANLVEAHSKWIRKYAAAQKVLLAGLSQVD